MHRILSFSLSHSARSAFVGVSVALGTLGALGACQASPSAQVKPAHVDKGEAFTVSSALFEDQGLLPAGSKCKRDGGDGLSPPLEWSNLPQGTQSIAVTMHHYSRRAQPGIDTPSHYWLLWGVPAQTRQLTRGNSESIGFMGANKDQNGIGYTPPCSPGGQAAAHAYTITLYALSAPPTSLGQRDDPNVVLTTLQDAIEGKVIASSEITFKN